MEPTADEIEHEKEQLRDIRRRSVAVTQQPAIDPDLPSSSPTSPLDSSDPGKQQLLTGAQVDPNHLFWVPAHVHPELAPGEFKAFLKIHASLARARSLKGTSSTSTAEDGFDEASSSAFGGAGAAKLGAAGTGGVQRKRSMLSKQYEPKVGDEVENEAIPGAVRPSNVRRRSTFRDGISDMSIEQLQSLEALAEEASKSDDPARLRSVLRRSLSLNVPTLSMSSLSLSPTSPSSESHASDLDVVDEDTPILPMPQRPNQILRRAARTKIRKHGPIDDSASGKAGGGHTFSSRRGRGMTVDIPSMPSQSLADARDSAQIMDQELKQPSAILQRSEISPPHMSNEEQAQSNRPYSFSEESSIYDSYNYSAQDDEELKSIMDNFLSETTPSIHQQEPDALPQTSPPPQPELEHPKSRRPSAGVLPSIGEAPIAPQIQVPGPPAGSGPYVQGHAHTHSAPALYTPRVSSTQMQSPSASGSVSTSSSESQRQRAQTPPPPLQQVPATKKEKKGSLFGFSKKTKGEKEKGADRVVSAPTTINTSGSGPPSGSGSVAHAPVVTAEIEEKEKDPSFFSALFSSKRKVPAAGPSTAGPPTTDTAPSFTGSYDAAATSAAGNALLGPSSVSKSPNSGATSRSGSPGPGSEFSGMNYSRYPIHVERAVYRLSHIKLANPRRALLEQVLISNLMFWYLGIINKTATPSAKEKEREAQSNGIPDEKHDDRAERERMENIEREREKEAARERERAEAEQRDREREMALKKESGRRGSLTKSLPNSNGRRSEMPVRGPQYELQSRGLEAEFGGMGGRRDRDMDDRAVGRPNAPVPSAVGAGVGFHLPSRPLQSPYQPPQAGPMDREPFQSPFYYSPPPLSVAESEQHVYGNGNGLPPGAMAPMEAHHVYQKPLQQGKGRPNPHPGYQPPPQQQPWSSPPYGPGAGPMPMNMQMGMGMGMPMMGMGPMGMGMMNVGGPTLVMGYPEPPNTAPPSFNLSPPTPLSPDPNHSDGMLNGIQEDGIGMRQRSSSPPARRSRSPPPLMSNAPNTNHNERRTRSPSPTNQQVHNPSNSRRPSVGAIGLGTPTAGGTGGAKLAGRSLSATAIMTPTIPPRSPERDPSPKSGPARLRKKSSSSVSTTRSKEADAADEDVPLAVWQERNRRR